MEEFIHQQNLERYRKMLSEMTHELQRQTILELLADEEVGDDAALVAILGLYFWNTLALAALAVYPANQLNLKRTRVQVADAIW